MKESITPNSGRPKKVGRPAKVEITSEMAAEMRALREKGDSYDNIAAYMREKYHMPKFDGTQVWRVLNPPN